MTLATLRQVVKGRYALGRTATADPFFSDSILNDALNETHHDLAAQVGLYQSLNLSITLVSGTKTYALDATAFRPLPGTFRMSYNSAAYVPIHRREYDSLLFEVGPFEAVANAQPTAFILRQPSAAEAFQIQFVPAPGASGTVLYGSWVYPPDLSADGDTPAMPAAEHDRLINGACYRLALQDQARGTADAPVQSFLSLYLEDVAALQGVYRSPGFAAVARGK